MGGGGIKITYWLIIVFWLNYIFVAVYYNKQQPMLSMPNYVSVNLNNLLGILWHMGMFK